MRRISTFTALAILACVANAQTTTLSVYRDSSGQFGRAATPAALDSPTITYSDGAPGWRNCIITFPANVAFTGTNSTVEIYFNSVPGGSLYDHGVILPLGDYTYKSTPNIAPGQAKVVQMSNFQVITTASATVTANSITISYPTTVVGTDPTLIQLRYLPSSLVPTGLWEDLNGAPWWNYLVPASVIGTTSSLPEVPFDSSPAPPSAESETLCGVAAPDSRQNPPGTPTNPTPVEEQDRELKLPPNMGPGDPKDYPGWNWGDQGFPPPPAFLYAVA